MPDCTEARWVVWWVRRKEKGESLAEMSSVGRNGNNGYGYGDVPWGMQHGRWAVGRRGRNINGKETRKARQGKARQCQVP